MEDWEGVKTYALYSNFHVAHEINAYQLTIGPFLEGDAGDGMSRVNDRYFTTKDVDRDMESTVNCALFYPSGFWFKDCFDANPNGVYRPSSVTDGSAQGIIWKPWRDYTYSLKATEMKIRPAPLNYYTGMLQALKI